MRGPGAFQVGVHPHRTLRISVKKKPFFLLLQMAALNLAMTAGFSFDTRAGITMAKLDDECKSDDNTIDYISIPQASECPESSYNDSCISRFWKN